MAWHCKKNKLEIGKTRMEFPGLTIYQGLVELQIHVFQTLAYFPNKILDKT
jgi:hypothetical protein